MEQCQKSRGRTSPWQLICVRLRRPFLAVTSLLDDLKVVSLDGSIRELIIIPGRLFEVRDPVGIRTPLAEVRAGAKLLAAG